ncbi:hypothetical protein MVES_000420 [Malassezia vespertilionis]|uniref:Uncharacterized protein n=1 Tax=Malassezia vespertilionis TaxID=2020962 RepID=A0A2N1JHM8_9BASI|nr:hypothetical protein MVES_000420 [Malassezia vespertilionis]
MSNRTSGEESSDDSHIVAIPGGGEQIYANILEAESASEDEFESHHLSSGVDDDADDADDAEDEDDDDDEDYEVDEDDIEYDLADFNRTRHSDSGNVFFVETDGEMHAEHQIRHLGLEELRQLLVFGLASFDGDLDMADEDDGEGTIPGFRYPGRSGAPSDLWEPTTKPVAAGSELEFSGDFGIPWKSMSGTRPGPYHTSYNLATQIARRKLTSRLAHKTSYTPMIPNSKGVIMAEYSAPCYSGQYSEDASFFYTCNRDMRVHIYDTTKPPLKRAIKYREDEVHTHALDPADQTTSLNLMQTVEARGGQWTITDVNLSPDNQWIIYSSISPYVSLSPVKRMEDEEAPQQVTLDFSSPENDHFGIWSLRFSGDSREILAGGHCGSIFVYDVEAQRRILNVVGHQDDVNSVAFTDTTSSNVFVSGGDDAFLKLWDRRSLGHGKPAGVLPGHTEGITYISPKGDGRYCISNSKDQSVRLWDLRNLQSSEASQGTDRVDLGLRNWDYRYMPYRPPRFYAHPLDSSVMAYRGHSVLRTLIRCYFSPKETTGQQYIYSGSADGRIHIWSLDGQIVQIIDRSETYPLCTGRDRTTTDPSAPDWAMPDMHASSRRYLRRVHGGSRSIVRDVSWHPGEPTMMSTSWDTPNGSGGSIAQHEWKGHDKV